MKQLFHIENDRSVNDQQVLSLRLGERHGCFAISNKSGSELYQLAYCTTDGWNEKELTAFITAYPSLNNSFHQVLTGFDSPQSIIIPKEKYQQEEARLILNVMGGKGSNAYLISELIPEWQLDNVYAISLDMHEWLGKKFPSATFRHQYSLGIKNINAATMNGSLLVDIRKNDFTVMAAKSSTFLLAQTFEYSTPDDVLYFLLKICQQFSLSPQDIQLHLSGLIDQQSSLYKELYQYFIHVQFRDANWKTETEYPAHFFTSLNDLAQCAS